MKILGLIPARSGSKGIPNKNSKELNGKPLIAYSIESALKSKLITTVAVSTDSDKILMISKKYGVNTLIKRPSQLASDDSPTIDTVVHALRVLEEMGEKFDAVCLLQPTSPFRTSSLIDECIQKFSENRSDSLVSVREVPHEFNPHWVFEPNEKDCLIISTGEKNIITRRQDLPKAFIRDGEIYITKSSVILNQNSLYGKSMSYFVNTTQYYVNLDTEDDWENATELLNNNINE